MVSEFELKKVPISIIKFDETNPNVLSDEQMSALKLTMEKYGYLSPVILNKDFTVIDGEHRVRIYQELEKQEIPAYVLDVDIVDQKILRQLMNKLKGEHDFLKDTDEIAFINNANKLEEFAELLGKKEDDFKKYLQESGEINFDNFQAEKDFIKYSCEVPIKKSKMVDKVFDTIKESAKGELTNGDVLIELCKGYNSKTD